MNEDLARAICLKVAFKGEPLRRVQAALLYIGLANPRWFTACSLPGEVIPIGDTTMPGIALAGLKSAGILEKIQWSDAALGIVNGRRKAENKSRNAAWTNCWCVADPHLARVWLERNGFPPASEPKPQMEMAI